MCLKGYIRDFDDQNSRRAVYEEEQKRIKSLKKEIKSAEPGRRGPEQYKAIIKSSNTKANREGTTPLCAS